MRVHAVGFVGVASFFITSSASGLENQVPRQADLIIYGGTSAGITAAIQARRLGLSVILVAPEGHLGGLTSGGLGWTDFGKKDAVGGLSLEFYRRVKAHYDRAEAWKQQMPDDYRLYKPDEAAIWAFEPHVAEQVFESWLEENDIEVVRECWLDRDGGVQRKESRIQSIRSLDGHHFEGRIFLDATYEGDLMAAAGVSYIVGREANSTYGETLNGVQKAHAISHQFELPIDPYRNPGDPSSGLLPRIHEGAPGNDGEADHRIQAYCFRVCLTDAPENKLPFPKPNDYDPLQYELLLRYLQAGWDGVFRKFDPIPNRKTDTNNHGAFSTDNIGMNYDYPEASYERRTEIIREHEQYQKGWFYFLANDPRVPRKVQEEMRRWGLAKDEFTDNGNWPHQIYVREARRMVSDFVMTENHLRAIVETPEPIGMGSYNMDSHNVQRYVDSEGHARNEGDIQVNPGGPYPISYRAIVPRAAECTNLLVPVCLSSSHIAYGSIRMEPVFMVLGQSAASAAAIAIDQDLDVQKVPYTKLRDRLIQDGQVLELERPTRSTRAIPVSALEGIVLDDTQVEFTGTWTTSDAIGPYLGSGYRHDGDEGKGEKRAIFRINLPGGEYEVRLAYPAQPNRAEAVPVTVFHAGGQTRILVNQRKASLQGHLQSLGKYAFRGEARVEVSTERTSGHVIVDGIQFIPKP